MEPFKITIIDKEIKQGEKLRDKLKENIGILDDFRINYNISNDGDSLSVYDILAEKPDMVILDSSIANGRGMQISDSLKEEDDFLPVLISSYEKLRKKRTLNGSTSTKIDGFIEKSDSSEEIQTVVRENMRKALDIGIIGLGRLGIEVLKKTGKSEFIDSVYAHTDYVKGDYSEIIRTIGGKPENTEFGSLEEVINSKPDILLITTGEHMTDSNSVLPRDDKILFEESWKKVKPVFELLREREYDGLVISESNPVEIILDKARKYFPNSKIKKLTSISADGFRARTALRDDLRKNLAGQENLSERDISLDVIGEHGKSVPFLEYCYVKINMKEGEETEFVNLGQVYAWTEDYRKNFVNLGKLYSWSEEYRKQFIEKTKPIGLETMIAAMKLRLGYEDTPNAILQGLEDITHFRKELRSSWHCFLGSYGFLIYLAKVNYKSFEIEVHPKIDDKEMRKRAKEILSIYGGNKDGRREI